MIYPQASVVIVESKISFSNKDFNNAKTEMKETGLKVIEEPDIFFSRSVLLEKNV